MRCPKCGFLEDKVVDSRASKEGSTIRRRRECLQCSHRFTTYEEVRVENLMVLKADGRREPFDKGKLVSGIRKACQKRPISPETIEERVQKIVHHISENHEREVAASVIGQLVMDELRALDDVAYVRFASVYRQFEEAHEFVEEVKNLEQQT